MILPILSYPDPRLKRVSLPVSAVTDHVRILAQNMAETMYVAEGVGLAAPQVGEALRLVVLDPSGPKKQEDLRVLINPVVTPLGDEKVVDAEGCLSVPLGYRSEVSRYATVRVQAQYLDGTLLDEDWEGFPAVILQHEVDHLDGKLFIDRISRLRRMLYDAKVKKQAKR